jgi:hypothetical protein
MEAVRLLLALTAQEGWKVHHMDVKTVFLNRDLQEEVFVEQPLGFTRSSQKHMVLHLHKALYGLHQAPRAWNKKLHEKLCALGFVRSESDYAIYCRGVRKDRLVVGVYVDDLVIRGSNSEEIQKFKLLMAKAFKMSDLSLLTYYLGIEVDQGEQGMTLSQGNYAMKILERCGLHDCNSCDVPMQSRLKLKKESNSPPVNPIEYRSLVGSLRYLVYTRPDLSFSVGYVSRFMEKPNEEHLAAVKHILRNISGTKTLGMFYPRRREGGTSLLGYTDSDLAGDLDSRRSTYGVLFFLDDNPVSGQSVKQRVVALLSCEAEYIVAATGARQGVWSAWLLANMTNTVVGVPMLKVDNKSALSLIKNLVHHDRSKHIDVRFHLIREYANIG